MGVVFLYDILDSHQNIFTKNPTRENFDIGFRKDVGKMRVVWKDSHVRKYHSYKYRGYVIEPCGEKGYTINIDGDDKIYSGRVSAYNAIDKYLGGTGQRGAAKRKERGIKVI